MWMPTTTTSKSHLPNWLDKLRKVKGFPSVNDGHSLDHFLSQQPHLQQHQPKPIDDDDDDDRLRSAKRRDLLPENDDVPTRMANMLSDLFCDGRSGLVRSSNLKAPRKQPSPRICILPASSGDAEEDKGSNESERVTANVGVDDLNPKSNRKVRRGLKENEKEERKRKRKLGECDLVGFSKTEVTVIDSSNPLWKFDKYLYRKKSVWKARDCRRVEGYNYETKHGVGIGRKKKREAFVDDEDDEVVVSKKGKSFGARK